MKAWLLSMIGVVFLIAIAEMLLPEGKLRKNIRGIFALILMLAVLKPLPYIKNADWNFDFGLNLDESLSASLNRRKLEAMQSDGEAYLAELGFSCAVSLQGVWTEGNFEISSAIVKTTADAEAVRKSTAEYYRIEAEKVVIQNE